ncbi:iron-hydroxamate ABC transporter substrate-binding protein [Paenibacillus sepulcri]
MNHSRKERSLKFTLALSVLLVMTLFLAACGGAGKADNNSGAGTPSAGNSATSPTGDPAAPEGSGTDTPNEAQTEKIVTDAMGHEVTIPADPQRILASYLEDHLVALGIKPVAQWSIGPESVQDYLQGDLKGIPIISYDLPLEAVASFSPDLILIGSESQVQKGLYEQYAKIAPTYVIGDEINKDWRKTLLKIGELLGKTEAAEQALKDYDQKVADTKAKLQQSIGTQSAAILWLVQKQFYIVDETRSSGAVLYGDLGMTPPNLVSDITAEQKATWSPVSLEKLAGLNADHIFLVNSDKTTETLDSPIWKNLPAVKAGHVYEMPSTSSWLYSGYEAGGQIMDDTLKMLVK